MINKIHVMDHESQTESCSLYDDLNKITFSKSLYISGTRALNIIDLEYHTGDWHIQAAWNANSKLLPRHLMGDSPLAFMDTNPYLDDHGIFNATATIQNMGFPIKNTIYAATHARALADGIISEAFYATPYNGSKLYRFVSLAHFDDFMPESSDKERVYSLLEPALHRLPAEQANHVQQWIDGARNKNYDL